MKLSELRTILDQLNIPVQYRAFEEGKAPGLPYVLFYTEDNLGSLKADNHNYHGIKNISVELYSNEKDPELEEKLEQLFEQNNIEYDAYEIYIETEKMFEMLYEITI